MAEPVLNPYEYQYMDGGVLLNGSTSLPFIDITKVDGLDLPDIDAATVEYDGRHGGFVYARFVGARTIVLDGTLYANPASIDTTLDAIRNNFMPRVNDAPFYFRGAGPAQRYIMAKPVGLNYDITQLRNYGACAVQFQLKAGDPISYVNKADQAITSGTAYTITNNGSTTTYPVVTVTGGFSEISFVKISTGETVTFTYATDADDVLELDFAKRSAKLNGVNAAGYITSLGWWGFDPSIATEFRMIATSANLMTNPGAEAVYTTGYAVGANWTGTQQSTTEKRSGLYSLKMARKNATAGSGTLIVPTGLTSLTAGTYTIWAWIKGSMPNVNFGWRNGSTDNVLLSLVSNSSKSWKKIQATFTIASTSGIPYLIFSDTGETSKNRNKGTTLYIDDMGISQIGSTSIPAVVSSKDGWL